MLFQATTYALSGFRPRKVRVDVNIDDGHPAFTIEGLPTAATAPIDGLVRSAVAHAGLSFPERRRVNVRISPKPLLVSEVEAMGLAIAVAILGAFGQVRRPSLQRMAVAGNLRADGTIGALRGALQMAEAVAEDPQLDCLAVASASAPEAACAGGVEVLQLYTLGALRYLGDEDRERLHPEPRVLPTSPDPAGPDFKNLRGIEAPRRAAEVAVAGDHSLLLAAPAGAWQSPVARRIPSILPPLRRAEALEVLRIASAAEEQSGSSATGRPFRSPVPGIDLAAMLGSGHPAAPGEVSLAHNGVLYLDQVVSFDSEILDAVATARGSGSTFIGSPPQAMPCAFFLVASTQLCPCGSFAAPDRLCSCDQPALAQYQHRLAAAAESFDMVSSYGPPTKEDLAAPTGEPSCAIRSRVMEARARQAVRLGEGRTNCQMSASETEDSGLTTEAVDAVNRAFPYPHLAGRRLRIARVARTVADLAGAELIDTFHLAEAIDLQFGPRPSPPTGSPMDPATAPGSPSFADSEPTT